MYEIHTISNIQFFLSTILNHLWLAIYHYGETEGFYFRQTIGKDTLGKNHRSLTSMPDRSKHPPSHGLSITLKSATFSLGSVLGVKWSECETPLCQWKPACHQAGHTYTQHTALSRPKREGKTTNERGKITSPNMPTLEVGSEAQGTLSFQLPH